MSGAANSDRVHHANLPKGGIREYNFTHHELSDSEDVKDNSNNGVSNQNPGSNPVAKRGRAGRPRGISKRSQDESLGQKKREDQPIAKERTHIAPEEDPTVPPPGMSNIGHPPPPPTPPQDPTTDRRKEGVLSSQRSVMLAL